MKNKLSRRSVIKINNRYRNKVEEFKSKSLEELKEMFNTNKMSSTDRQALIHVTDYLLKQRIIENSKDTELDAS